MTAATERLPAKRILVMRYRFIGDTILTVPFLRNLRAAYPDAQIDVLVGPQSGSVLDGCPYINNAIVFDTTRFHKYDSGSGQKGNFLSYAWQLRTQKYDIAFVLKRSLSSALLAWLSGARYRVGYDTENRCLLLTHKVAWRQDIHEVESTLDVLRAGGVPISDTHLEAWISPQEKQNIEALVPELQDNRLKVLIHAAAAHPDKIYPSEHWAKIIAQLKAQRNVLPFFTGAAQDHALYEEISRLSGVAGVNLAGKLSLRQSMSLYQQMSLAICVDSGPAHLAAATGTPTIALFGPTDPERWAPWGKQHQAIFDATLSCRPCHYRKTCDDRRCLTQLNPEIIINRSLTMLPVDSSAYARK